MDTQAAVRGALRRAARRMGAVRFLDVSAGGFAVYCVGSSQAPETGYRVTVDADGVYRCTCPAELGPACWHRAAVYLARAQRMAGGLGADGPTVGQARRAAAGLKEIAREFACE